jgi:hypothetical protein
LPFSKPQFWSARNERLTRRRLKLRWIYCSRTFGQRGWFQFRHHVLTECTDSPGDREGQQQVLRVTFTGIRDSVRVLLEVRMDRLALKFHATKDLKVRDEIYGLCGELIKLDEPWKFVVI